MTELAISFIIIVLLGVFVGGYYYDTHKVRTKNK